MRRVTLISLALILALGSFLLNPVRRVAPPPARVPAGPAPARHTDAPGRRLDVSRWSTDEQTGELLVAIAWAQQQGRDRFHWLEFVLTGTDWSADLARTASAFLRAATPEDAAATGTMLLGALVRTGRFDAALEIARDAPAECRLQWLTMVFQQWGRADPDAALRAAAGEAALPFAAAESLIHGWAHANPEELATSAELLPSAALRSLAIDSAIDEWLLRDAGAVSAWLMNRPAGAERDRGLAQLVMRTDKANRDRPTALAWIAAIEDPDLRAQALTHLNQEDRPMGLDGGG